MSTKSSFPETTVIQSFLSCEEMLADVLQIVPYCDKHKEVWSWKLATVVMEACSQLDSLWGYTAWLSPYVRKGKNRRQDLSIEDHWKHFSNTSLMPLGKRWVVFWGEAPVQLRPYAQWDGAPKYEPLDWWQAYNKLKHDRLANKERATLSAAIHAAAGLFLAILHSEHCRYAVEAAGWLSASDAVAYNPKASLGEDSPSIKDNYVAAESRLFAYPVGWCRAHVKAKDLWQGSASFRFKHWFENYST